MKKSALFLILTIFLVAGFSYAADVKDADLAGSWYPASKTQLENQLKSYLDAANPPKIEGDILAIIVPHAGYQYSGPVAAYGYKAVMEKGVKGIEKGREEEDKGKEGIASSPSAPRNDTLTVIILGFSHRQYFDGIAIYDKGSWKTPLGEIQIDESLAKEIEKNPRVKFNPGLFSEENSVEMQVPFIQVALGKEAKIVPIAFGTQDYRDAESLAATLAEIIGKREKEGIEKGREGEDKGKEGIASSPSAPRNDEKTSRPRSDILIIASTDMSHYHPYAQANSIDKHTIDTLNKLKAKEFYDEGKLGICELCGLMPVTTVLLVAQRSGYDKIKELKYANSGDITGDKSRVVGYYTAAVYRDSSKLKVESLKHDEEKKQMLNDAQRKRLLEIARESITNYVKDGKKKQFTEKDPLLNQSMGAFVTLHEGGELRGCIGNMVGSGPLYQTVADMAIEAATGDPRFQRLSPAEIGKIKIEISVLSPLKRVNSADEITIPGDGVIVRKGFRSGVYLPQVATETGWKKEEFLTSLCAHKANISSDAWKDPTTELYKFTAEVFGEEGGR